MAVLSVKEYFSLMLSTSVIEVWKARFSYFVTTCKILRKAGAPCQSQEPHCKAVGIYVNMVALFVFNLQLVNLVELVQVRIIRPVESSQALHGHRDLHEGGEVANVEVVNTVDLPLGEKVLRNGQLSLQVFHCLLIFPCLKCSFVCLHVCHYIL